MCTAISYKANDHYFGRNLDWMYSYGERVTITPRNYAFKFKEKDVIESHYAIIGMALVRDGYPLYFDATNEVGLSVAGLNFPDNAVYFDRQNGKDNIAPYELIPWVLSQCKTVSDAKSLLMNTSILNEKFSDDLELTPMHWIISDRESSIVAEPMAVGLEIFDNSTGVLTNNPPFPMQMHNLNNYMSLSVGAHINTFSNKLELKKYSNGMGAIGLPGDFSSQSRFVRGAFVCLNSQSGSTEPESVSQFFHILSSVEQVKGCVKTEHGYEYTIYSSCCNTDKGIYYYKTYDSCEVKSVALKSFNLDGDKVLLH